MDMKKIHRSNTRKIASSTDIVIFDEKLIAELEILFTKIEKMEDKTLQSPLIDFMIVRLVAGFESAMKTLCATAFDDIEGGNSYDFDDIQIPIRDLKRLDNVDIDASSLFASSFNFQNPYVVNTFFSNIFKKDLWDLFRKFIQINPTFFVEFLADNKEEAEIVKNIISSHNNINRLIDEFIEMFDIRNKIAHDPTFSSKITFEHLGKMWMVMMAISMFILMGVMAKTRNQDKEEMEMIKKYKMDDVLKITFSE